MLVLLLAGGGVGAWKWFTRERPVEVQVATVTERAAGTQAAVLNASGYVTARRRATVSSKITGKVIEVNVEEGMAVKEGQVLARLDDATPRAALALAEAQAESARHALQENEVRLAQAKLTLGRQALLKDGIVTQADVDLAKTEVDATVAKISALGEQTKVAERQVDLQKSDLDNMVIRAPFSGIADLEGRAARRDGVAGVGRRRIHAHRHLHDRRHALARNRRRRQRELHQPREAGTAGLGRARRVSGLADSRRT